MVQKASPKLTEMLNQAIAGELQAIVQYMWHHVMVKGMNAKSLSDVFEEISVAEMKHAEKIAERLFYFDVNPTTKPNPIATGGTPEQMLKANVKAEEEAITLYKDIIKQAASEGDETTPIRSRRFWDSNPPKGHAFGASTESQASNPEYFSSTKCKIPNDDGLRLGFCI
jgi:bacterioferritin